MLTFLMTWNDFFWPIIVLSSQNPTVQVSFQSLATGYAPQQSIIMAGTLYGTIPVLDRVRPPRPADRRRHHARSGQGMTTERTASLARLRRGASRGVVPDRGRRHRGRSRPQHLGHVLPSPRCDRQRRHRRRRLRPLPPVAGRPRPDAARSASRRTASRWRGRGSCPTAGSVNQAGLDFYKRLVDGMLERDIRPLMTLYHWDLPQALDDGGEAGWLSRDLPDRFVDYAMVLGKELGDRVPEVHHAERAVVLGVPRLRDAASTPRGVGCRRWPIARPTTSTSPTVGRCTALRGVLPPSADLSVTLNLHQVQPASDRGGGPGGRGPRRPDRQPDLPRPDVRAAATPRTCWPRPPT